MPIRLRLTLWYTVLLAGALVLFSAMVFILMANSLLNDLDAGLLQRAKQVEATADVSNGHLSLRQTSDQTETPLIPAALVTRSGRVVSGNMPPAIRQGLTRNIDPAGARPYANTVGGLRVQVVPLVDNGRVVGEVVTWQSTRAMQEARRSLLLVLGATVPVLLIIAALGGLAIARRALSPVTEMIHGASRITVGDLHQRLPVSRAEDELSELATTFNALIARLEGAVVRERQFTADASHELRSPLAVIRAETSLALDKPRDASEYRRALAVADQQARSLEELIAALLLLARVETFGRLNLRPVALSEVVRAAIQQSQPILTQRGVLITSRIDEMISIMAAPSLFERAVRNVIENAARASEPGTEVRIDATVDGGVVTLSVADSGAGIPLDEQTKIFDAFYQVAPVRTPGDSHGLGLAIVRRIVEAHRGRVGVRSSPGTGTQFRISLPMGESPRGGSSG